MCVRVSACVSACVCVRVRGACAYYVCSHLVKISHRGGKADFHGSIKNVDKTLDSSKSKCFIFSANTWFV